MSLHQYKFGNDFHTSLTVRANKMDWSEAMNRLQPTGLIRFAPEDEP